MMFRCFNVTSCYDKLTRVDNKYLVLIGNNSVSKVVCAVKGCNVCVLRSCVYDTSVILRRQSAPATLYQGQLRSHFNFNVDHETHQLPYWPTHYIFIRCVFKL